MAGETVIKFGAKWCQPCKAMAPVIARAAEVRDDRIYMDIDVDEVDKDVLLDYGVRAVPTVIQLDHEGNEIARAAGAKAAELL